MSDNKYMRRYKRARYRRIRGEMIEHLGGVCAHCGTNEDLQFDHIDPSTKELDPSKTDSHSIEKLWSEIRKCQLLCPSCHRTKSISDLGKEEARCGTLSGYRYCGPPKCEACRAAKREYMRKYRLKRPRSTVASAPDS